MIKEAFKKLAAEFAQAELWEDLQISFEDDGTVEWWSHHPGLAPSPENATDEELDIMCQALKAGIFLRRLIDERDGDVISLGFDEMEEYPTKDGGKEALLLKPIGEDGYACDVCQLPAYDNSDERLLEQMADNVVASGRFAINLSMLQGLRKAGTLQCRLIYPPTPIKENDDAIGYYPRWLLAVVKGNGMVIPVEVVRLDDEQGVYTMLTSFCESIFKQGHAPLQISVPDYATECLLKTLCRRLNVVLVRERYAMKPFNDAWKSLFSYLENDSRKK